MSSYVTLQQCDTNRSPANSSSSNLSPQALFSVDFCQQGGRARDQVGGCSDRVKSVTAVVSVREDGGIAASFTDIRSSDVSIGRCSRRGFTHSKEVAIYGS